MEVLPANRQDAYDIATDRPYQVYAVLDAHLADRPYVMGNDLTMADIPLGAATWRWQNLPIRREEFSNVESWMETLQSHESFRKHVAHPLA